MDTRSRLCRTVDKLARMPEWARWRLLTWAFGRTVHFVRTAGARFEFLSQERALLRMPNRKRAQNHVGSIHAAAVALLAEASSGAVLAMNLPSGRVPLLKSMQLDYVMRYRGDLRAEASLDESERTRVRAQDKGEVTVPVRITDAVGAEPIRCHMVWAWISRPAQPLPDPGRSP